MRLTASFSRLFPFYNRKDRESNRSWSGFNSTATSRSTNSSHPTYHNEPPQIIHGSWIDGTKLRELLNQKFGSEYTLETRSDNYRLYANGKLTNEEIMWCAS
ncbi:hypothetical protein F4680DRAFT_404869 [Xylaria scruposa]|nr:hypothetical protein F4680DRAFT_404869 [Xylaria scruposa]